MRGLNSNALASAIFVVARRRQDDAPRATRADVLREIRTSLPSALASLKAANIAPVDLAQAAIGPGMAIFSRYSKVLEADGSPMTVHSALQLINAVLDEDLNAQDRSVDSDTRFAITWFEANGWNSGSYGDAETLAKARNVAVAGVVQAGIAHAAAGRVRLVKRSELPVDWDPTTDARLTTWEATQHLIKRLESNGETAAATLLKQLGPVADHARDLAYRLYTSCERKGWAEDARAYNGLVIAWPELEKLAAGMTASGSGQLGLGLTGPTVEKKRPKRTRRTAAS
jgi:putative DNA methylase